MAATLVGTAAVSSGSGTELTIDLTALTGGLGSTALAGDTVVLSFHFLTVGESGRTLEPTTSGYTKLANLFANDTYETNLYVGHKIMGGTPDTTVVVPSPVNGRPNIASVEVWRGVDSSTPIDVTTTTDTGVNGGIATPPAITPVTTDALIIIIGANSTTASEPITAISSGYSNELIENAPSTTYASLGTGSKAWISGTETPGVYTGGGTVTTSSWAAVSLVLRPAASTTNNSARRMHMMMM